jgi:hypothetical protein
VVQKLCIKSHKCGIILYILLDRLLLCGSFSSSSSPKAPTTSFSSPLSSSSSTPSFSPSSPRASSTLYPGFLPSYSSDSPSSLHSGPGLILKQSCCLFPSFYHLYVSVHFLVRDSSLIITSRHCAPSNILYSFQQGMLSLVQFRMLSDALTAIINNDRRMQCASLTEV